MAHNNLHTPATSREPFCLVAREADVIIGGALGWTAHRWCYVDILTLVPEARGTGQGALLLTAVESLARDRNCIGVYLFSYSFQAPSFYERFGYASFEMTSEQKSAGDGFVYVATRASRPTASEPAKNNCREHSSAAKLGNSAR